MKNKPAPIPPRPESTYENRVAAFRQTEKKKSGAAKPTPETIKNPYRRAWFDVRKKSTEFRQKELLDMEGRDDLDNRFYADFVHEVALLGDSYCP